MSDRNNAFVDFIIKDEPSLGRLLKVTEELKQQKQGVAIADEEHWLSYFNDADRTEFWWPSDEEVQRWDSFWFSTPLPERHSEEMPMPPWDFGSMIKTIFDGEYDIVGVRKLDSGRAKFEIDPYAYPYGGVGAIRTLVRCFGHKIIGYNDGTGYVSGDLEPPRWMPDMAPLKFKR